MTPLVLLDFEASSLSADSYPIEVGWCSRDLARGWSCLIRPVYGWDDWSSESQRIHGLPRWKIEGSGLDPREVLDRLDADLAGCEVLSDNPWHETLWLERLAKAAGRQPAFEIPRQKSSVDAFLRARAQAATAVIGEDCTLLAGAMAGDIGLVPHRALDDAMRVALRFAVVDMLAETEGQGAYAFTALREETVERARALLAAGGRRRA